MKPFYVICYLMAIEVIIVFLGEIFCHFLPLADDFGFIHILVCDVLLFVPHYRCWVFTYFPVLDTCFMFIFCLQGNVNSCCLCLFSIFSGLRSCPFCYLMAEACIFF